MASCGLGIPATSAPSEQVFSRSKTIIRSQRHSLKSSSIEQLLCVKECNQVNDNAHSSNNKDNKYNNNDKDDDNDTEDNNN
ncbi:hypothetical protein PGTUg99_000567 [Puccinia graminis f. sp. tritici]|uniref:HAT C-terminal dimerisation domain-containing protein n=1 Tax=Puccinia graminis f. sp. tritici TaxID=56615 RepID=A0A5B0M4B7_PUCGR|nr:hypothetical protein PGTUg99_000567 [Puccinia graminis f. sp. tritici]